VRPTSRIAVNDCTRHQSSLPPAPHYQFAAVSPLKLSEVRDLRASSTFSAAIKADKAAEKQRRPTTQKKGAVAACHRAAGKSVPHRAAPGQVMS